MENRKIIGKNETKHKVLGKKNSKINESLVRLIKKEREDTGTNIGIKYGMLLQTLQTSKAQ